MKTSNIDFDIDEIARKIHNLAQSTGFDLYEPVNIEYGYGWEPTLSFWYRDRRIHLYWGWPGNEGGGLTVEVAKGDSQRTVLVGMVHTFDELWNVFEKFLKEECEFADLPDHGWTQDPGDHDKFIPHPPSKAGLSSGNVAAFVEYAQVHGKPWQPVAEKSSKANPMTWLRRLWKRRQDS